jgi:hypothetical protein
LKLLQASVGTSLQLHRPLQIDVRIAQRVGA